MLQVDPWGTASFLRYPLQDGKDEETREEREGEWMNERKGNFVFYWTSNLNKAESWCGVNDVMWSACVRERNADTNREKYGGYNIKSRIVWNILVGKLFRQSKTDRFKWRKWNNSTVKINRIIHCLRIPFSILRLEFRGFPIESNHLIGKTVWRKEVWRVNNYYCTRKWTRNVPRWIMVNHWNLTCVSIKAVFRVFEHKPDYENCSHHTSPVILLKEIHF